MSQNNINDITIFSGYSDEVISFVNELIQSNKIKSYIESKYPETHNITTDKALFSYAQELRKYYMKNSPPIHKVSFDKDINRVYKALGLNLTISKTHGRKTKTRNEIKIASIFKKAPKDFLRMIIIHEIAHLKVKDHDKKFYNLCSNMEYNYHELEFDLRLFLLME